MPFTSILLQFAPSLSRAASLRVGFRDVNVACATPLTVGAFATYLAVCNVVAPFAAAGFQPPGASSTRPSLTRTRLAGLTVGPFAVGFDRRSSPSRPDAPEVGVAMWYPAAVFAGGPRCPPWSIGSLRYARPMDPAAAAGRGRADSPDVVIEAHGCRSRRLRRGLGFRSTGIARRGIPRAKGRFPVVVIFGGPYYLATTAEYLASHGFAVVAPFRYADGPPYPDADEQRLREIAADTSRTLDYLNQYGGLDLTHVSAVGHGGGGLQALSYAWLSNRITAVVNIDAGNFSTRTGARTLSFYSPPALRVPYLLRRDRCHTIAAGSVRRFHRNARECHGSRLFSPVPTDISRSQRSGRAVTAPLQPAR